MGLDILIVKVTNGVSYEAAWAKALKELGHTVLVFDCEQYFKTLTGRITRRILNGKQLSVLKNDLFKTIRESKPRITLFYQGHYFDKEFIQEAKAYTFVAGFHNDSLFSERAISLGKYKLLRNALGSYDTYHFYRKFDQEEGSKVQPSSYILMPYHLPWLDYPRYGSDQPSNDLIFIGHYENDHRASCMNTLADCRFSIEVKGEPRFWSKHLNIRYHSGLRPVYGDEYREYISKSLITACFFSKWNNDIYTRRLFEIMACRSMLLTEATEYTANIFKDHHDAVLFANIEEFRDKAMFYMRNRMLAECIAARSAETLVSLDSSIYSRMKQWLNDISEVMG